MDKKASDVSQPKLMSIVAIVGAMLNLVLYPLAGSWRFPGGTPSTWYWCLIFNIALLFFNLYALGHLQSSKLAGRLCIYISLAVTVYIFVMLVQLEAARELEQKRRYGVPVHVSSTWEPKASTATQQGAAPDRLQPALRLVPRLRSGFRRRVSLVVVLLRLP